METDDSIIRNLIRNAIRRKKSSSHHSVNRGFVGSDKSRHERTIERRKGQLSALRRDLDLYLKGDPIATERLKRGIKKSKDSYFDPSQPPHSDVSWLMIQEECESRGIDPNVFL